MQNDEVLCWGCGAQKWQNSNILMAQQHIEACWRVLGACKGTFEVVMGRTKTHCIEGATQRMATFWGRIEACWSHCQFTSSTIIFAIHVNDIVSATFSPDENVCFKDELKCHWGISDLGPAKFALGITISWNLAKHTISISQTALINHIINQFNQTDANPADTPMVCRLQLCQPDKSLPTDSHVTTWMERTLYRSLIGSLMYISRGSRPDIAYAVSRLASHLNCYHPKHWEAAIHVLRYLKGLHTFMLSLEERNGSPLVATWTQTMPTAPIRVALLGGIVSPWVPGSSLGPHRNNAPSLTPPVMLNTSYYIKQHGKSPSSENSSTPSNSCPGPPNQLPFFVTIPQLPSWQKTTFGILGSNTYKSNIMQYKSLYSMKMSLSHMSHLLTMLPTS